MANICLMIGTTVDQQHILNALTTLDGLCRWWTHDTTGNTAEGGVIHFRFGSHGGFDMKVLRSDAHSVHWECVSGPDDWLGTRIEFDIQAAEKQNRLMFRHAGWAGENTFFHHCSTKWAVFLLSLKDCLEQGSGRAYPNDVKIEAVGM